MFAIASLLDTNSDQETRSLWDLLYGDCGLLGVYSTPTPHLTWQVAENYSDVATVYLERISKVVSPVTVRIAGLGIFTGERPVVHLSVVKTPELLDAHRLIWSIVSEFGMGLSQYYSPELWMPHITLAYKDVAADNLFCAVERLAFQKLDIQLEIDNLALIFATDQANGVLSKYGLRAG